VKYEHQRNQPAQVIQPELPNGESFHRSHLSDILMLFLGELLVGWRVLRLSDVDTTENKSIATPLCCKARHGRCRYTCDRDAPPDRLEAGSLVPLTHIQVRARRQILVLAPHNRTTPFVKSPSFEKRINTNNPFVQPTSTSRCVTASR
jgi:hypothetical protein